MNWVQIAEQLVAKGAPTLGGILLGPAGGVLGNIIGDIVGAVLGVSPTPEAIGGALQSDPDASVKMQQIEAVSKDHISALEAAVKDMQSARDQTVELAKEGSSIAWGAPVMSTVVAVAFSVVCGVVLTKGVADSQIVVVLVTTLANKFATAVDYWLGSSFSSREKDSTISTAVSHIANTAANVIPFRKAA